MEFRIADTFADQPRAAGGRRAESGQDDRLRFAAQYNEPRLVLSSVRPRALRISGRCGSATISGRCEKPRAKIGELIVERDLLARRPGRMSAPDPHALIEREDERLSLPRASGYR